MSSCPYTLTLPLHLGREHVVEERVEELEVREEAVHADVPEEARLVKGGVRGEGVRAQKQPAW